MNNLVDNYYEADIKITDIPDFSKTIVNNDFNHINLTGLKGSSVSFIIADFFHKSKTNLLILLKDKENAAYLYNDLENLSKIKRFTFLKNNVFFYPKSQRKYYTDDRQTSNNILLRTEILNNLINKQKKSIIVTFAESIIEKIISSETLKNNSFKIVKGSQLGFDFFCNFLSEYNFVHTDFVYQPGQYSIRGGIIDVFSYSYENPYRIEFDGDIIESIRSFDVVSQLSITNHEEINIIPNINQAELLSTSSSIFEILSDNTVIFIENIGSCKDIIKKEYEQAIENYNNLSAEEQKNCLPPKKRFINENTFTNSIKKFKIIEWNSNSKNTENISFNQSPQISINKKFDFFKKTLINNLKAGIQNYIFSDNPKQIERIETILKDLELEEQDDNLSDFLFIPVFTSIHEGFTDYNLKIAIFTDHQLFNRFHRYRINDGAVNREALTIKDLTSLKPGDYVTHIDYGIGRFSGLEKIEVNGKIQECIRIVYKDNDILYVGIHSLHKISKYSNKDGTPPVIHRLGGNAWKNLKEKAKKKVKELAIDLVKLYSERKHQKGFAFSPDNYLQAELEASFIFEDTPDQIKTTAEVKKDMESEYPMDRLICGDVGFGKTEIAIRAAFKAVCDSKQVAVLVPTTILAMQHYKTFSERLNNLPCNVDYISRFKSSKEIKKTIENLKEGKIDIIIGTHRLLSKDVIFKDLGLLIIDEEQKFGVAAKEKLRELKTNVDTLTLTATPIPRTLQFSLLGARDLSVISTPPPNRIPVKTEIHNFSHEIIREALIYEYERGGQSFFVHNRVENIENIANIIKKICPELKIAVAHGQMNPNNLEITILDFIEGNYDVLVCTSIIENGIDIPNANTIIINNAQNFGLSDLHQLRGRVGRSNKKAYCYLLIPSEHTISDEAKKRLRAIEEFSDLGSGFNIAMRDLDIRGAGNLLGPEQSGFINEMGYETYLNILQEAIQELKNNENINETPDDNKIYVKECHFESDLDIYIPDEYVNNQTERLIIYKELNNLESDTEINEYLKKLTDRFGSPPQEVINLFNTLYLRRIAKKIGFEKVSIKNNKMTCTFISDENSEYYKTNTFGKIIDFFKTNPTSCKLRQINNRLMITWENVNNIDEALTYLQNLMDFIEK